MLREPLVSAVNIGKPDGAAPDLALVHSILHEELGQKLTCSIAGSLAVLGVRHGDEIIFFDTAVLVPRIHGIYFRCGAVDIFLGADAYCLLQKSIHAQHVRLKSLINMIEMLGMNHRCAVNIYRLIEISHLGHDQTADRIHLLRVIKIVFKKIKSFIVDPVTDSLYGRSIEIIKSDHMILRIFCQYLSHQLIAGHASNTADNI